MSIVRPLSVCYITSFLVNGAAADLAFTSPNLAGGTQVTAEPEDVIDSDHLPVQIKLQIKPHRFTPATRKKWKMKPEYLFRFKQNIPKSEIISPNSTETVVKDFTERIYSSAIENIGLTSGGHRKGRSSPWWDRERKSALSQMRTARKILSKHLQASHLEDYYSKTNT